MSLGSVSLSENEQSADETDNKQNKNESMNESFPSHVSTNANGDDVKTARSLDHFAENDRPLRAPVSFQLSDGKSAPNLAESFLMGAIDCNTMKVSS